MYAVVVSRFERFCDDHFVSVCFVLFFFSIILSLYHSVCNRYGICEWSLTISSKPARISLRPLAWSISSCRAFLFDNTKRNVLVFFCFLFVRKVTVYFGEAMVIVSQGNYHVHKAIVQYENNFFKKQKTRCQSIQNYEMNLIVRNRKKR